MIASNITIDTTQLEYDLEQERAVRFTRYWDEDQGMSVGWDACARYVIALLEGRG